MNRSIVFEQTNEFRDHVKQALDRRDDLFFVQVFKDVNEADIATLLHEFSAEENQYVLSLLPHDTQALIVLNYEPGIRKEVLGSLSPEKIAGLLNKIDSDDIVDILNELPIQQREEIIFLLDEKKRNSVVDLMRYPENVAGGLMAKELVKVLGHYTVVQCVREIRRQTLQVSKFYTVYVVDKRDKLLGQISLQQLILSDLRNRVDDLVDTDIISVETYMEDLDVAKIMRKYDLESVPVVQQGRLVGRITIDDVVDVITEQAEEDRQIMSGFSGYVEEDVGLWKSLRVRLPWLIIGIVGGVLSARFMGIFEKELASATMIAFFIPLLQATGGNVGIQSSSLIVQSIAKGYTDMGLWRQLGQSFIVSLFNGLLLSLMAFGFNVLLFSDHQLSMVVSFALFVVVVCASVIGTFIPLFLHQLKVNPAMSSGPFITTLNDLIGLTIYFLVVQLFLG